MIIIDDIKISKNPVETQKQFVIEVTAHEDYENAKRYANQYPYRYGEK